MLRLYLLSLLVIVLALLVSLWLGFPADPGYLLLWFGGYTFETSLFALLTVALILFLLWRVMSLLWHSLNPWRLIRHSRIYRRERKSVSRSVQGLLDFARGDWQRAYNLLNQGLRDTDASVINYLAAACAAYATGDSSEAMGRLDAAEQKYPAARTAIRSLRARLLFQSNQLEQCLAVLEQLRRGGVNDAALLGLLKDVYIRLEDWQPLETLLPALQKHKVVDQAEGVRIRERLFMEGLYQAAGMSPDGRRRKTAGLSRRPRLEELTRYWKKAPAELREDPRVVRHYVNLLLRFDATTEALHIIETALARRWDGELAARYGSIRSSAPQQQLQKAEYWLQQHPRDSGLLLSLARISRCNQLWGKAREYYEASIKATPSAQAHGELSELLAALGQTEAARRNLYAFRELTDNTLLDLPLPTIKSPVAPTGNRREP